MSAIENEMDVRNEKHVGVIAEGIWAATYSFSVR